MVLTLKGAEKIFFDPDKDKAEDFGLTNEQLQMYLLQGGFPVRYNDYETEISIKNASMEAVYLDADGIIKLFTKSGSEFGIVNKKGTYKRIKEVIEFDGNQPY